jgi:hypothetical protein
MKLRIILGTNPLNIFSPDDKTHVDIWWLIWYGVIMYLCNFVVLYVVGSVAQALPQPIPTDRMDMA